MGRDRKYTSGVYKRLPNGQINPVKIQDNYLIRQEYTGTFVYSESSNICDFSHSLSGNNVAFIVNCEANSVSPTSPRPSSSKTAVLSAEINGQLREAIQTGSPLQPLRGPSIFGSSIVYDIQNIVGLYNNGQFTRVGMGGGAQIARDNTVLFNSFTLWRNGVTTTMQTPYGKPSPDGVGQLNQICDLSG
ncbi:MAG: hypothetical protein HC860_27275 [Alkalinema sp. RU_4_3]|nr:hypothetical protein [Alkalinema sp. RU_4_3]